MKYVPSRVRVVALLVALVGIVGTTACSDKREHYGFITTLGNDTIAVERITRTADLLVSEEVERFPRVRRRHSVITLLPSGGIRHMDMDITEPGGTTPDARERHFTAEVGADSVRITVADSARTQRRAFPTGGRQTMVHVSQMYSVIELFMAAGLQQAAEKKLAEGDSVRLNQFYADREFDEFPLHQGWVRPHTNGTVDLWHDWLSGMATAVFDTSRRMQSYSGQGTTYKVQVKRVGKVPDVNATFKRFADAERARGGQAQLSVRDTARGAIGRAKLEVDYGRPLARGRKLLGNVIEYGDVWRTGANAATQFSTSAPITIANLNLPAGKYTLWTVPRKDGSAELRVNSQTGQWGTGYDGQCDLGGRPMVTETVTTVVDKFTISIRGTDATHGALIFEWGDFRWTAPIVVR